MSNSKEEKQYGLILPKKQQRIAPKVNNVFGDNNDSDEEDGTDWVKKALQAEGEKNKIKRQVRLNMQKALKEDPTIFQYDEVYDDMERTKDQSKTAKDEKKKPRYIQNLLKAAERRKKEQEYRIERMVQKEREAEGEMYADKESFVTSAYRAKLEEFKKMEEEENKMDKLEAIADVKKQQDISGFYRHLYKQTVVQSSEESGVKNDTNDNKTNLDNNLEDINKEINVSVTNKDQVKNKEIKKNRQYRQRKIEEDSDTDTEIQQKMENKVKTPVPEKHKNVERESERIEEPDVKKQKQQIENAKLEESCNETKIENPTNLKDVEKILENSKNDETEKISISAKEKIEAEKRERSKIWEKRTVGPVFEAALQRYYARKSMRLSVV
ncbi:nuclear speckle splicing regulatory protein 1 [Bombus pyrosoma]|uniref:nuclear speckle splicing regulatory protein 1 n=1 Tax=Bombus pyrosoma TaxID=396416 RepID=UPI001CB8B27B|nr:nuclear speckle splicing regulatory protein 1 [Bombus pyrosoma]XP_043584484.1 nuclear speckle splicing regulatory protein 1 [Bombus pyrosoma]XP_043584485.1 nuclear speckle splicing regulatory protein 1 [Bombus pyrosoma]XP_043584486.1 nuclear speckle splicing regulatory protein 1 [Bombus pyrosoma]